MARSASTSLAALREAATRSDARRRSGSRTRHRDWHHQRRKGRSSSDRFHMRSIHVPWAYYWLKASLNGDAADVHRPNRGPGSDLEDLESALSFRPPGSSCGYAGARRAGLSRPSWGLVEGISCALGESRVGAQIGKRRTDKVSRRPVSLSTIDDDVENVAPSRIAPSSALAKDQRF